MAMVATIFLLATLVFHARANIETLALAQFKQSVNDPLNRLESWDVSLVTPCNWFHITCDSEGYVISLYLPQASLSGVLVPELGSLTRLQYLELNDNHFSGPIPVEFGNLARLESLDLYGNLLSESIPDSLGNLSDLKYLRLNRNLLTGTIPLSLTNLWNLQVLDLSDNRLRGRVPTNGSFSRFTQRSFVGNTELCGPDLPCFIN